MPPAASPPEVVFVAYPLRNGRQAIMPRRIRPRCCVRLDGVEKIVYASRADARHGCGKHERTYRCGQCGAWHRATKTRTAERRETWPAAAWVARRVA